MKFIQTFEEHKVEWKRAEPYKPKMAIDQIEDPETNDKDGNTNEEDKKDDDERE